MHLPFDYFPGPDAEDIQSPAGDMGLPESKRDTIGDYQTSSSDVDSTELDLRTTEDCPSSSSDVGSSMFDRGTFIPPTDQDFDDWCVEQFMQSRMETSLELYAKQLLELPSPENRKLPKHLEAIMEPPLSDEELQIILEDRLLDILRPNHRYYEEVSRECHLIDYEDIGLPRPDVFQHKEGAQRQGVIARHNVKRRWEQLGIWNPQWGFPGRHLKPEDDYLKWTWKWQPEDAGHESTDHSMNQHRRGLIERAFRQRRSLRRGQRAPMTFPNSRLEKDASPDLRDTFLISRPWFMYHLEVAEEEMRYFRLDTKDRARNPHCAKRQVIDWWKERGDWRDDYDDTKFNYSTEKSPTIGWTWPHESPLSPSPSLAHLRSLLYGPCFDDEPLLSAARDMEYTSSEIDELETVNDTAYKRKYCWTVTTAPHDSFVIDLSDCAPSHRDPLKLLQNAQDKHQESHDLSCTELGINLNKSPIISVKRVVEPSASHNVLADKHTTVANVKRGKRRRRSSSEPPRKRSHSNSPELTADLFQPVNLIVV
ncbi:hypothetical protein F5Y16DRAFT_419614 [Xylariaceae sp. FL0255]|nr:hypothetical protein F5Y16DRAFT_419614 [Xylariaceae sp. FL0255]